MFELLLASFLATAQPSTPTDPCVVPKTVTTTPNATYCNTGLPPERFQHKDVTILVTYKPTLLQVNLECNGGELPTQGIILACTRRSIFGQWQTILPDPCIIANDPYAGLVCHELGHVNGWPIYHGD